MDDQAIIDLYWDRSEEAIVQTDKKYGKYCFTIANRILENPDDSEECVSDTYMSAWNRMPPVRPQILSVFLGKITRNISVSRWRKQSAVKRGGGTVAVALEELEACTPSSWDVTQEMERKELEARLRDFCGGLPVQERIVFLKRYWYAESLGEIAAETGLSQSAVKSSLYRSRKKLGAVLKKEGLYEVG